MPTTILPLSADSRARVTMRWKEPYVTEGINKKLYGVVPHGIYRGFVLSTSTTPRNVTLVPDATYSDHVVAIRDDSGNQVTLRIASATPLEVPLGAPAFSGQTVVIAAAAIYSTGGDTTAEIQAFLLADWSALTTAQQQGVVALGTVVVPSGSTTIASASISHTNRSEAWMHAPQAATPWTPLLKNASFEQGRESVATGNAFAPWQTASAATSTVYIQQDGIRRTLCAANSATGACAALAAQELGVRVDGQTRVRVVYSVKSMVASSTGNATISIGCTDSSGTALASLDVPVTTSVVDLDYRVVDSIYTLPVGTVEISTISIQFYTATYSASGAPLLRIDGIQVFLEQGSSLQDTDGYRRLVASGVDFFQGNTSFRTAKLSTKTVGSDTGLELVDETANAATATQPALWLRGALSVARSTTSTGTATAPAVTAYGYATGAGSAGVVATGTGTNAAVVGQGGGSTAPTATGEGVIGSSQGASVSAVKGVATGGGAAGVEGSSSAGAGTGVLGYADGSAAEAMHGEARGSTSATGGVFIGGTVAGAGVVGKSNSTSGVGVQGSGHGGTVSYTGSPGVVGGSFDTGSPGVYGVAQGDSAAGVSARAQGTGSAAVYGVGYATAVAAKFEGAPGGFSWGTDTVVINAINNSTRALSIPTGKSEVQDLYAATYNYTAASVNSYSYFLDVVDLFIPASAAYALYLGAPTLTNPIQPVIAWSAQTDLYLNGRFRLPVGATITRAFAWFYWVSGSTAGGATVTHLDVSITKFTPPSTVARSTSFAWGTSSASVVFNAGNYEATEITAGYTAHTVTDSSSPTNTSSNSIVLSSEISPGTNYANLRFLGFQLVYSMPSLGPIY